MKQTIVQVDAFTDRPFRGNPAAVCVLASPQDDEWLQLVAQEMNLSETAFLLKQDRSYSLRWFTPTTEVPLCGHATLASAHVLWTEGYASTGQAIEFETKSGTLTAKYQDDWIELDFPVNRSQDIPPITKLGDALGVPLKTVLYNSLGYLVEVATVEQVEQLRPNLTLLEQLPISNVIVTSRGRKDSEYDFVSRFFAPGLGIDEDPVTGAAHCCLASYWRDSPWARSVFGVSGFCSWGKSQNSLRRRRKSPFAGAGCDGNARRFIVDSLRNLQPKLQ